MLEYKAPERDIEFLLFDLFKVQERWAEVPALAEVSEELARAVISEAGRVAGEVLAPINQSGDDAGCTWEDGVVSTPPGFKAAFAEMAGGGWLGLAGNPEYEGQGMPKVLGCVIEEMFWAANTSLYLYGTLTAGCCICIDSHGTEEQKRTYLPKLYSGQWSGAMDLTEPHAGSDLGIIRTRAVPHADGSYRISGTKIFITSGEHDLAENIVHLVLAKLPDAPAGSKGISLFIVPKYLPDGDDGIGGRNGVASGSIEHKMGIRGSATNVMNFDEAVGYMVGEPNQGLACMFTMMNYERLSVGLQGLGAGELAYQQAASYARDRLQGRSSTGPKNPDGPADSLLVHADVRRMLLTVRSLTEAGRAFALFTGMQLDLAKHNGDEQAHRISELLTPIAKAFLTDRGFDAAVIAQQVFGGHGFIKEWGAEQIVRDARIGQIYEGTNGIQASDLIGRKVLRDGGATLNALLDGFEIASVNEVYRSDLEDAFTRVRNALEHVKANANEDPDLPGAVATDFLDLVGYSLYAWFWAQMGTAAGEDEFGRGKRECAAFYFARILPRILGLEASILSSSACVMGMAEDAF
jgi:alkylation response protein AidB-like acyl-CoA dehydrogenase